MLVATLERHGSLGEEATQQLDLLGASRASVVEVLSERFVLDGVPTDADAEPQSTLTEDVDRGCLLRDEGCLALGEDDHAADELELGDAGEEAEQDERLVERRVDVVRAGPAVVDRGSAPSTWSYARRWR